MKRIDMNKVAAVFITVLSVMVLGGIAYAFFSANIPNINNEKVQTKTASMSLAFADGDNGVSGSLNLGQSLIKKFSLENTGTTDAYGKINWHNLVNTYTDNSLTWILEQSETEDGTYVPVASEKVPTSSAEITEELKNGLLVPVNSKYYYKLTITLNNLDEDQSGDIDAIMHSNFSLESGSQSGVDKIQDLMQNPDRSTKSSCTNTLAYDGTVDNNLRYIGANPCNYVSFNNELWRIIGVMNNVDDGTGKKEARIKLVRSTSLGNYSWDTSSSTINNGWGVNDWSKADLMKELNTDYLNTLFSENQTWYNGQNDKKSAAFDITKVLGVDAQRLISDAVWNLGGASSSAFNASAFYSYERGSEVWGSVSGQVCADEACPREASWTGKVALMYPSDYGFAVGNNNRNACLETSLNTYNNNNCHTDNWLYNGTSKWLLTPGSNYDRYAFAVDKSGYIDTRSTYYNNRDVLPVVYLKSNVSITSGTGSLEKPYELK